MIDEDIDHLTEELYDEISESDGVELHFNEEEVTDHKVYESVRMHKTWSNILTVQPEFHHTLQEIDEILRENNHEMPAHITSDDFAEVSLGSKTRPDNLRLRISQTPEQLSNIDNYFFQQMTEERKPYHVEGTPVTFEIGPLYDETFPVDSQTTNLHILAPTLQDFYDKQLSRGLEAYSNQVDGDIDISDLFTQNNTDYTSGYEADRDIINGEEGEDY